MREVLRQLVQTADDAFGGRHFVCARGQLNPQPGSRLAVVAAEVIVFLRSHFHGRDVAKGNFRAVLINPKGDIAELFRGL